MAYVNRPSHQQRAPILIATVAIQAGLFYVLVNGFGGVIPRIFPDEPLVGDQIPLPQPQPTETPKDQRTVPVPQPRPSASGDSQPLADDFKGVEVTEFPVGGGSGTGNGEGGSVEPLPPPLPTPKPQPLFTPKAARPLSAPSGWVTSDDYPSRDLREEREGITRFRLSIGTDGLVKDCAIVASSGSPSLDAAACAKLRKRGRFAAATDESGAVTAGSYSSAVRWKLPID